MPPLIVPDLFLIACLLMVTATAFCRALASLRAGSLDYFPTVGWILGMVIPFMFEWFFFQTEVKYIHFTGILLFTLVFFAGDELGVRIIKRNDARQQGQPPTPRTLKTSQITAIVFFALSIALIATHLALSPNIPLLEKLLHKNDVADVANRSNYYRNISSFWLFPYAVAFNLYLFGIPVVLYLVHEKKRILAFVLFCVVMLYAASGNAKGQLVVILTQLLLVYVYTRIDARTWMIKLFYLALAGFLTLFAYNILVIKSEIGKVPAASMPVVNVTDNHVGDYYRSSDTIMQPDSDGPVDFVRNKTRYLFYRTIITPIEVSARWYQYFNAHPVSSIRLSQTINDSRSGTVLHPSNAVGKWAYAERFPVHYYDSIHAYTSVDADAHGRFGLLGWLIAAMVYLAFRLWIAFFYHPHSLFRRILYGSALIITGSLTPSSSIQGLMVPNGLGAIGLAMAALYLIEKRAWDKTRTDVPS